MQQKGVSAQQLPLQIIHIPLLPIPTYTSTYIYDSYFLSTHLCHCLSQYPLSTTASYHTAPIFPILLHSYFSPYSFNLDYLGNVPHSFVYSTQCISLINVLYLPMYSAHQSTLVIRILHLSVYSAHQCTPFISVLYSVYSAHQCTPLISILHSSVYSTYSTHKCNPLISVIHSPVYSTYQCAPLINVLHSVYSTYQCTLFISVLHPIYCTHQCTLLSILHLPMYTVH